MNTEKGMGLLLARGGVSNEKNKVKQSPHPQASRYERVGGVSTATSCSGGRWLGSLYSSYCPPTAAFLVPP